MSADIVGKRVRCRHDGKHGVVVSAGPVVVEHQRHNENGHWQDADIRWGLLVQMTDGTLWPATHFDVVVLP